MRFPFSFRPFIFAAAMIVAGCASSPRQAEPPFEQPAEEATEQRSGGAVDAPVKNLGMLRKPIRSRQQGQAEAAADDPAGADKATLIRGNDRMFVPPSPAPSVRMSGEAVTLRFEQAPVAEVVHAVLGDILQVPYAIDQPLQGAITLHTHTPLARDKVFPVFEAALLANGLGVVRDAGGVYHVGNPETLRSIAPSFGSANRLPAGHGMVIVPLQYVGAAEMADILRPVAPSAAFVRIDTFRNLLILAGSQPQIEGWMEIVGTFDIDILKGMSLGLFPLKHTSVKEVDTGLKALLAGVGVAQAGDGSAAGGRTGGQIQEQSSAAAGADPGNLSLPGPLAGVIRVVALERLNALLVITPRAHYLDIAREWIQKFDQPRTGGSVPQLYVYPVQNGTARHLAGLLNAIFGGEAQTAQGVKTQRSVAPGLGAGLLQSNASKSGTASMPRLSSASGTEADGGEIAQVALAGNVRVVADDQQNALLIHAPGSEYAKIEAALRKLDISPTQVLIEASILEVTLNDELKYGLQWYFNGAINSAGTPGLGQLTSGDSSTIGVSNPGFSYTITNSVGKVRAILNALATKSLLNVISSPSIMVLDNHLAEIHVGDQQPIQSSTTVTDGGNTTSSIQYKDTGVMLSVLPSVNAGGMVSMQIAQSVTDVGGQDAATGQRSFLQRQLSSRVAVRDGETIVLGGLIRDNNSRDRQGIPLLHDIPVLGNLFGSTTRSTGRTELLVMLTPKVIKSEADLRQVGDEMRQRMRSLELLPDRIAAGYRQDGQQQGEAANEPTPAQPEPVPAK